MSPQIRGPCLLIRCLSSRQAVLSARQEVLSARLALPVSYSAGTGRGVSYRTSIAHNYHQLDGLTSRAGAATITQKDGTDGVFS